ncbi:MAG TPA: hypothetical protein PLS24_05845 [Sedimentisphaerales bacterium]|nr:hypothetical protein [Sedimentisphaerales bacterium]
MSRGISTFALVAVSVGATAGCATNRVNLVSDGTVSVQVADCHPILLSAKIERDGDETIISGGVTRRPPMEPGRIHIDVTITAPTGEVITETTALVYPRTIPIRHGRTSRFAVWFPFVPPRGSTVRLVCDSAPHPVNQGPSSSRSAK